MSEYDIVIGLEVHVHLKTATKLFCRCTNGFSHDANTQICPVCTGQPGTLPVINKKAVEQAVKASLALNCDVQEKSVFARKQYFYPDLPKNYQISQYELPIALNGNVDVGERKVRLTRAHMEEDAGKLIHTSDAMSLVDYNRTGSPLLEIVSEPEIDSPQLASDYLKKMRHLLRWYDVSDCDMEKGSMRCDANISLKEKGASELGVKVEIKNLNSFKAVEKALEYEIKRQAKKLDDKETIMQETRLWDDDRGITLSMRSKEEANDYRYFPEPDLPVLVVEKEDIKEIRSKMPDSPGTKIKKLADQYKIDKSNLEKIFTEICFVEYFEHAAKSLKNPDPEKVIKLINWISGELFAVINSEGRELPSKISDNGFVTEINSIQALLTPEKLARLVDLIEEGTISGKMAKDVFSEMWASGKSPEDIIEEKGLKQITSGDEIEDICRKAVQENPEIVEKYKSGKEGVLGALVGAVMKESKGQANPKIVNQKLLELLAE
ncbi:MAG: Asp-tRNA(Asn)/Glu-tRNA(Gln) amidotransferase subunit GatB [Elusimicrobiota bacterium]